MRTLTLVGRLKNPKILEMAVRCAWCRRWESVGDYIAAHKHGVRVSHGICKPCSRKFLAQLDAIPTTPDAA